MKQREFTSPGPVLDEAGRPVAGYSTHSMLQYDRAAIRANAFRIKEWDFYQVSDRHKCLQFTLGHASYAGQVGIMFFDFEQGEWIANFDKMLVLPFGSLKMPADAEASHTLTCDKGGMFMQYETRGDTTVLRCRHEGFETELTLTRENPCSIALNVPFDESPTRFYYNQKINCMRAAGQVKVGDKTYVFDPGDSFGLLDWGRGVWPFHNEWFWSNGTGLVGGEVFGFNLGCGFGNTETATENTLFWHKQAYKLGRVSIRHEADYMQPWHLDDDEGRLSLTMTPSWDRTTKTKLLFIDNECHQVFGRFDGFAVLDDGTKLEVRELFAFAEHAVNNW